MNISKYNLPKDINIDPSSFFCILSYSFRTFKASKWRSRIFDAYL